MRNYEKKKKKKKKKICKSKSQEKEHDFLKMEKDSSKNTQEACHENVRVGFHQNLSAVKELGSFDKVSEDTKMFFSCGTGSLCDSAFNSLPEF